MNAAHSNIISLSGRTERRRSGCSSRTAAQPDAIPVRTLAQAKLENNGYVLLYRHGMTNHCPGCGKSHWIIGNRSAECAFCATALDFQRLA